MLSTANNCPYMHDLIEESMVLNKYGLPSQLMGPWQSFRKPLECLLGTIPLQGDCRSGLRPIRKELAWSMASRSSIAEGKLPGIRNEI